MNDALILSLIAAAAAGEDIEIRAATPEEEAALASALGLDQPQETTPDEVAELREQVDNLTAKLAITTMAGQVAVEVAEEAISENENLREENAAIREELDALRTSLFTVREAAGS